MDQNLTHECIKQITHINIPTAIASSAAVIAAVSAIFSYRLSKNIYDEIKSDEVIISGELHHPELALRDYSDCVLRCTLFNKSKRKAFVSSVKAYSVMDGKEIDISWSKESDNLGKIINPTGLLGIDDSINLVFRRNDGLEFQETRVALKHSFSKAEVEILFDPYKD
ncbi:MAG: hypothetical protein ACJAWW_001018 [Sulfurimonas sp.]|jgi:hypothetical protein